MGRISLFRKGWIPAIFVATLLCLSCSPDPQEEVYVPIITNSWTDLANANHKFNLTAQQVGVSNGSFNGTEELVDSALSFPLNGTFSNRNVSFIVTRRGRDTTYVGRFTADTLLDFGALKIFRRR